MEKRGLPPDFEQVGIHLFPDYKFYCSGLIVGWNIRALTKGEITLSLWRMYGNHSLENTVVHGGAYWRVGDVTLYIEEGFNHVSFPVDQQREVTAGDIIGLQYRSNDSNAVIAFEQWACEPGTRCYSEDIFISNESPNSLKNATTRLSAYAEKGHLAVNVFSVSQNSFFPKILPIIVKQGKFIDRFPLK